MRDAFPALDLGFLETHRGLIELRRIRSWKIHTREHSFQHFAIPA